MARGDVGRSGSRRRRGNWNQSAIGGGIDEGNAVGRLDLEEFVAAIGIFQESFDPGVALVAQIGDLLLLLQRGERGIVENAVQLWSIGEVIILDLGFFVGAEQEGVVEVLQIVIEHGRPAFGRGGGRIRGDGRGRFGRGGRIFLFLVRRIRGLGDGSATLRGAIGAAGSLGAGSGFGSGVLGRGGSGRLGIHAGRLNRTGRRVGGGGFGTGEGKRGDEQAEAEKMGTEIHNGERFE